MKIFIAGATGAVGQRLVPLLISRGHQVVATTRTPGKLGTLRSWGAEPVLMDGLDEDSVTQAVTSTRPGVIVHEMTALSNMRSLKNLDDELAITNRLRTEGTRYLIAAALATGVQKFVVQSYAGWPNQRVGGRIKTEADPLDTNPPSSMSGVVLRYASLYGPGTSIASTGFMVEMVRGRKFPLVGNGAGVWSFLHVNDAARATERAIDRGAPGLYNICDDEPAEVATWLPELARVLGAKRPIHLPVWIARFAIGEAGVSMMTKIRGSSNAKAKRALGWELEYPSWRDGFRRGLEPGSGYPVLARAM
jgi:2-alkyl-3-oxoalkanoate reductase